jgi:hypothetical protein
MPHETARPDRGGTRLDVPSHPGEDDSPPTFDRLMGNSEIMPTRCAERRGQRFHRETFVLCFRQWTELRDEQRVFVKDGQIQGITRYDYLQPPPIEYTGDHIDRIGFDATDYLADIAPHMLIADFVFDFGYRPTGETVLIELNPYGLSDPCCFGSYKNIAGYAWNKE